MSTGTLCKACRQLSPDAAFKWLHTSGIYCSQTCVARAALLFPPRPRRPLETVTVREESVPIPGGIAPWISTESETPR